MSQEKSTPTIIKDENYELRKELINKAATLQKYVHFEASMRPHIEKLLTDANHLAEQCDNQEEKIAELNELIRIEKESSSKNQKTEDQNNEERIQHILDLEQQLKSLLAEKAKYLRKALINRDDESTDLSIL